MSVKNRETMSMHSNVQNAKVVTQTLVNDAYIALKDASIIHDGYNLLYFA